MMVTTTYIYLLLLFFQICFAQENCDMSDAKLKVPELLNKYNYPNEVHEIATSDGYFTQIHRILCRNPNNPTKCPTVLLMHALMTSSASWIINGPNESLAYMLADAGYDVWMGNLRGNEYSKRRRIIFRDNWNYDITTLGKVDLYNMITYILNIKKDTKFTYICHSLSCITYFVMRSETNFDETQIDRYYGLAPLISLKKANDLFVNLYTLTKLTKVDHLFGFNVGGILRGLSSTACVFGRCNLIFNTTGFGVTNNEFPECLMNLIMSHMPEDISSKVVIQLGQSLNNDFIRPFRNFFFDNPWPYNITKSTVKKYIYYGLADRIVFPESVEFGIKHLQNVVNVTKLENFAHFSLIHGPNLRQLNEDIIKSLKAP